MTKEKFEQHLITLDDMRMQEETRLLQDKLSPEAAGTSRARIEALNASIHSLRGQMALRGWLKS